jgi:chromosome segregation ATPase
MASTSGGGNLTELKTKLKDTQDQLADLNKTSADLQSQIKIIEAKQAEIQKAVSGYDELSKNLQKNLNEIQRTITQKLAMAEVAVKDVKSKIDKAVGDFNDSLKQKEDATEKARENAKGAAAESEAAAVDSQQKDQAYMAIKALPKSLEGQLKDLKSLLDQAAKVDSQSDLVSVYFLLAEAQTLARTIKITSAKAYQESVEAAQDAAHKAKDEASTKRGNSDKLSVTYDAAKAALDAARGSRRADILRVLKDVQLPAAVPVAPPAMASDQGLSSSSSPGSASRHQSRTAHAENPDVPNP